MFFRTQCKAASWSRRPSLPEVQGFGGELRMGEEADDSEAVINGDDDDSVGGERPAVVTFV